MDILIADKVSESGIETLTNAGYTVTYLPTLSGDTLAEALSEHRPQVLVVRSTEVTADMMNANPRLELIVRAGAGYNTIDVDGASNRGIFVANCPGKNSVAVAELTIGLIISLDRFIPHNVADAKAGIWNKATYSKTIGLKGRTLGIIGLGNIGREVARRAKAFDLDVIAWSRSLTDDRAQELGVTRMESPNEVAKAADIVTIHVAATKDTAGLANRAFFEAIKPGAFFINTTRSQVVDEDALLWAMNEKGVRAAIDVMSDEPEQKEGPFSHPLATHPNLYITHHIGASTAQAQDAIATEAVRVVYVYGETGVVPNVVNIADHSTATHQLTVRHLDKVGVLAAVLNEVSKVGWNVQEMENLIFSGANAACAHIRFDGIPDESVVTAIANHADVLAVSLIPLE